MLNNSIRSGAGNMYGFIGERVIADVLGAQIADTFDYDILADDRKVEAKTKMSNQIPKSNYEASLADFNTDQECDFYFFVRVRERMDKAFVLGFYPKDAFYADATFRRKGEYDFYNGFKFKADGYNIQHKQLYG